MTTAREIIDYLDEELAISEFRDYGPNGLQVEGRAEVTKVVTGVSANARLIEAAQTRGAALVIVHHGLIWGPGLREISGVTGRRVKTLIKHDIGLAAYHLPLDKHARLGNNVGLCDALGLQAPRQPFGQVRGHDIGLFGEWATPLSAQEATARIQSTVCGNVAPQFAFLHGPPQVRRVGVCSGAASDLLEEAAAGGCDMFVTGELAERAEDVARELRIHLVAAGHYATEVFGPQRIAKELSMQFPAVEATFVPAPSAL